ncbi:thiamine phosphate synthase [Carboxylicivirga linearis]|uniref:Thiamine phosphate synthase n=1 Tax=Carboxylicivirga linearis TaxID=1628157 RepID=A0ABS5JYD8_9BACT|nr:thiamine phosphate synthase [Carboxylicivirga linearis]MBS2099922.1 thiamine phosphate synthase [Carboxylicivirga linearis]
MRPIVITHPSQLSNEFEAINALFENGLEILHVRKPDFNKEKLQQWIKSVDERFHKHIMIHSHLSLVEEMNLKGVHFTSYNRHLLDKYIDCNYQKSTSTHSLDELKQWGEHVDYAFLSPVFESISKKGYMPTIKLNAIHNFLDTKCKVPVIALGGIDSHNADKVKEAGFEGLAILGSLWSEFEKDHNINKLIRRYNEIANKWS